MTADAAATAQTVFVGAWHAIDGWVRAQRWFLVRATAFIGISVLMVFPRLDDLEDVLPGDPGDAFLILTILRWGADHAPLFSGYWDGPMFVSGHDVMAYTDTFLPLTVPFKVIEWATGSPIVAMNLLFIASWAICAEVTWRLFRRVGASPAASFVASLAFTFSTLRLAQTYHFQLAWALFIPLGYLAFLRIAARPTILAGAGLGLVVAFQFMTSAYYGVVLGLTIAVASLALAWRRWGGPSRAATSWSLMTAGLTAAVVTAPVAVRYLALQRERGGRGPYPEAFAMRLGDLRAASPSSRFLDGVPLLNSDSLLRSSENYAYVGLFVIIFVPVALAAAAFSRQARVGFLRRPGALALVLVGAFLGLAIAVGRGPFMGVRWPFYDVARVVVPGVKGMTAIVREAIFFQLGLCAVAALGLTWVVDRVGRRWVETGAVVLLATIVLAEGAMHLPFVRVPRAAADSSWAVLVDEPAGNAVELPMAPPSAGVGWAFLDATRMVLGHDDGKQIVNGYSGFQPEGFAQLVETLNTFPSQAAIDELRRLGVRYVMVNTQSPDSGVAEVNQYFDASGYGRYTPEQLDAMLSALPPGLVERQIAASNAVILVLADDAPESTLTEEPELQAADIAVLVVGT